MNPPRIKHNRLVQWIYYICHARANGVKLQSGGQIKHNECNDSCKETTQRSLGTAKYFSRRFLELDEHNNRKGLPADSCSASTKGSIRTQQRGFKITIPNINTFLFDFELFNQFAFRPNQPNKTTNEQMTKRSNAQP